jgi:hypothetical protein
METILTKCVLTYVHFLLYLNNKIICEYVMCSVSAAVIHALILTCLMCQKYIKATVSDTVL